ncbi:MAG: hypothetical protein JJT78_18075 [Leptospira sp.]|nr:hypothetical protein [Leptospira sp.]
MSIFFSIFPENSPKWELGGSSQTFQSRFVDRKDSQLSSIWLESEWQNFTGIVESRGERSLAGGKFQNDYVAISAGHRYKTVPGFFLGRDERYYSTLTKHQPIKNSGFMNFLPGYFSPGIFWLEDHTGDKAGFSIVLPEEKGAFTYSPETEIRSLYLNLFRERVDLPFFRKSKVTLQGESIGSREDYFGRYFFKWSDHSGFFHIEGRIYKDDDGKLFESRDDFQEFNKNPIVAWGAMGLGPVHRVEAFDSVEEGLRRSFHSARLGLWDLGFASPAIRYREYREIFDMEDERIFQLTRSHALLWMGYSKKWNYFLGREFRETGEYFTEAGLEWNEFGWRVGGSVLFQREGNILPTPIERFTGMDRLDVSLTDRKTVIRLRLKTKFMDWNVTASDRMGRRGAIFFMNLQFHYDF